MQLAKGGRLELGRDKLVSEMLLVVVWIGVTLAVGCVTGVLAKRFGVDIAVGAFAGLVVVANVLAAKAVVFGPFVVPAGVIVYSTSFLVTDILAEKWGKKQAIRAVWTGFWANLILAVSVPIAIAWEAAPFVDPGFVRSFAEVLGPTPRIVAASMVAYLVSQHHDVFAFHFWKKKTGGKHLWIRNNASTIVSQLVDSVIFITLAFYGVIPKLLPLILGQWAVKILIAVMDTPFCYLACRLIEKT